MIVSGQFMYRKLAVLNIGYKKQNFHIEIPKELNPNFIVLN